jgi:phosphate transport system permease protein
MSNEAAVTKVLPRFDDPAALRRRRWRGLIDRVTRYVMAVGGISVIGAIVLIFFYLLYVVIPLFRPATVEMRAEYPVPGGAEAETLLLATEEYAEIGLRLTADGRALFFRNKDGSVLAEERVVLDPGVTITSVASGDPSEGTVALGLSNGKSVVLQHVYEVSYPNDKRAITPRLRYPLGKEAVVMDDEGVPLTHLAVQSNEQQTTIAAATGSGRLIMVNLQEIRSFLGDTATVERKMTELAIPGGVVTHLALNVRQTDLYLATDDGFVTYFNVSNKAEPTLVDRKSAVPDGVEVTELQMLAGGISVLVGDSQGRIAQWFAVRDQNNKYTLARVREFHSHKKAIHQIAPEYFRKGFAAVDEGGVLGIHHATAHRTVVNKKLAETPLTRAAISPRADALLLLDQSARVRFLGVDNDHPEVSWNSLWGKVWYESRQKPEYIWQSSSASSDFEPKFSLTPLAFGTFKASLYAMIFAIPLSIMGAIYAGYFMAPRMRDRIKPLIEVMGALPTVILGFLAGLWLAPLVEQNLPGIFAMLILFPIAILMAAFLWSRLPGRIRHWVPDGWEAALLIPVICAAGYLALCLSLPLEMALFDGNMRQWVSTELGLTFDQRNSLVVGIAMGFAVVPIIFSISEDAIVGVPRHLTLGSLALGATPWQTLVRVVLLTASPGIFSAIMIGFGRAVGETMIVLMATGNTPIMDLNIFQGFRALSANVAVEMPESEVGSTHFRILFLASLVLFSITFLFNTVAELVRQRLRDKYSTL